MPLSDVTVVDVATLGAAPQVAAFFGDLGARVIKVEPPSGDPLRHLVDRRGFPLAWKIVNRNKSCVTLDLDCAEGRELLDRLLERADLLVCAAGPERLARWRLEPSRLAARFPRLVAVDLTAFGIEGPWAGRPGSGTLAEAVSGLAALTGAADGPPTLSPVGLGDHLGVLEAIVAALVGLRARERDGSGGFADVAMVDPLLRLLSLRLAAFGREGRDPGRRGNRFPTMAPRNAYRTADGEWVALTAGTDGQARRVLDVIGGPELADDPRFGDARSRLEHGDELDALIARWIARRSRDEVVAAFVGAGVSLASIDGLAGVRANPHLRARGSLVEVDDGEGGMLELPAPGPRLGPRAGGRIRCLGRDRGADNRAIFLEWLGLGADELERLERAGVV